MKSSLFITLMTSLLMYSCKEQPKPDAQIKKIEFSYPVTIIPHDTTKLWVAEGLQEKDTVLILCQGGPKDSMDFIERGKSSWKYLPNYDNYYKTHLHQATTLNTDIFRYDGEFTMEMARKEVDNTSEILYRAIKYFKDKGKTVYVMGHSYGAFIIPHYLATRPSLADKYVIISGRIDDPKHVVEAHEKGFNGIYENGVTFKSEEGSDFSDYNHAAIKYYTGKQRIKAAIGEISYSTALKEVDLSSTTYIYNPKDDRVGGLTQAEITFLKSKKVSVFSSDWEHSYTIRELVDQVVAGKIKL